MPTPSVSHSHSHYRKIGGDGDGDDDDDGGACCVLHAFVVQLYQCVIIEARVLQEVEGGMEAVNGFVKTAPTFIAKVQVYEALCCCRL